MLTAVFCLRRNPELLQGFPYSLLCRVADIIVLMSRQFESLAEELREVAAQLQNLIRIELKAGPAPQIASSDRRSRCVDAGEG